MPAILSWFRKCWDNLEALSTSIRVSDNYSIMSGLLGILAFLQLLTSNARNPMPGFVAIGLIASGVCFGIGFGGVFAKRQLFFLEKNRRARWSLQKTLYLIGGLFIFAGAMFLVFTFVSYLVFLVMLDFLFPFLPAFLATQAYLFKNWERKHKKTIWQRIWSSRLYVYP
jgi:hypothetical protein